MTDKRTALVLGATGGIGGELVIALLRSGWHVRALHRQPAQASGRAVSLADVQWVGGDAMRREDVVAAAHGSEVIIHGVNPPGYRNWRGLALPMLDNSIAAAKASGARLMFPGTVYNFGPDAFPNLSERSPQHPRTRKGKIRVAMEQRLEASSQDGVRTLIVRAGDYFGPRTGNSWFAQGLIKPGRPVRAILYPGRPDAGHAWAYLPDLATTVVQLLQREQELADFASFHFAGHWLPAGIEMAHAIQRAVGKAKPPPIRRFPWALAYAASPFVTVFREMLELRYLWQIPVRLDNAKLVAFLGAEPHTPIDTAVRATLIGLGCLPGQECARPAAHSRDPGPGTIIGVQRREGGRSHPG
jgi:nucleoside-diphosphate-sugar epimerase